MTDSQQRLDRSLRSLLGEHALLIKTYKHEEVVDLLISARNRNKSSIEFDGNVEHICESRLKQVGIRTETFVNAQNNVVTVISW